MGSSFLSAREVGDKCVTTVSRMPLHLESGQTLLACKCSWHLSYMIGQQPLSLSGPHAVESSSRETANGGAKRIVRFSGGKTYYRARPPKPVLEAAESSSGLRPFPFKENERA